jgi:hypothetical protein
MSKIKTYKGFDGNLQCRGFQYKVGETYTTDENIELCENGFHAIAEGQSPLSVFSYYHPATDGKPSRYCEVEADGEIKSDGDKICCSQLTVGAEIGIPGIVKAHIEWVKKHCKEKKEGGNSSSVSGGEYSSVSGGDSSSVSGGNSSSVSGGEYSSVSGGNCSSVSGGYCSSVSGGEYSSVSGGNCSSVSGGNCSSVSGGNCSSVSGGNSSSVSGGNSSSVSGGEYSSVSGGEYSSVSGGYCSSVSGGNSSSVVSRGQSAVGENGVAVARGNGVKVKGGLGSLLVCAIENDNDYNIKEWKSAIVDGKVIKADTWYTVKDGEFVEVTE